MRKTQLINLNDVRIHDAFWSKYTALVTKEVIPYQWKTLNDLEPEAAPSHSIMNFKVAAGLEEGSFYGEVFQDSDVAKWLEAVAYSLSYEPNQELEATADEVISIIAKAQRENGYLDTYFILKFPGYEWTNLREGHELYCAGHMTEAAVAYYKVTGKTELLDVCKKLCDLIIEVFHRPEMETGIPGHEEIELALVKLYEVTNEKKYLDMAKTFIDRRGTLPSRFVTELKNPKYKPIWDNMNEYRPDYAQSDVPVRMQAHAEGHAVRAVYLYSAMADIAGYYQDEELFAACERLWTNITTRQMYITGGIGSSGYLERFTTDYHLPNESNYSESCASIGLALFARRMCALTQDAKYMDTVETALYNTVLGGIAMDGKSFFYVNPLSVWPKACIDGTDLSHVKPVRQKWFGTACCPPNIARTLASLGEYCYFVNEDALWINLFVSSTANFTLDGKAFTLTQETRFPFKSKVVFTVDGNEEAQGTVAIRIPSYAKNPRLTMCGNLGANESSITSENSNANGDSSAAGDSSSAIDLSGKRFELSDANGKVFHATFTKGYLLLEGAFLQEEITLTFEMPAHFVHANPQVRADAGRIALVKGPVVYCLEEQDNGDNLSQIVCEATAPITECFDADTLQGTLILEVEGYRSVLKDWNEDCLYGTASTSYEPCTLRFIPYGYWDNRTPGEMITWIREKT